MKMIVKFSPITMVVTLFFLVFGLAHARYPTLPIVKPPPPPNQNVKISVNQIQVPHLPSPPKYPGHPPHQNTKVSVNQFPGVFPIPHYPEPPKHPGHPPHQNAKISLN
ncbi:unnamed protein product [Arabidopsis lyrata]|uniref:Transmembrane protein n=1 Tax=Arabidopsis lyrata subsp. lyrata TaxID=81972 RepID=D7LQ39_ARALL|nr:hypothetical protein ARALYDRAFT_904479 [Arabidopsis lyrata subsp. lyrata]CAH8266530.1 unnamed protein product [Arabidopsis lyrata]